MGSSLCPIIGQGGTFFAFPHLPTAGLLKKTLPINNPLFLNKKDKPAPVNRKSGEEGRSP
ncbi:hypothetical protein BREVNS_2419 [Brevinematales bacterium NS]|nr:hypothetical protein BREVNS_2419 [Brevinematales bacterium NS]